MQQHEENMALNAQIDAGVDAILAQTETMKTNATEIGTEIGDQIEMAKDINDHMDQTDANINKATDKLKDVQKVSGGGLCSWILCLLFFVLTILILVLPPSILDKIRPEKRRGSW
ncbi:hypothetical protein TRFO_22686 [Tritrichomonas foetus]|uniref:t-SNARE coiled-coil homology domain-containing protein n=1 Tax=Tritrichomonas foetus TaxID=1144522 RepID=A0A1J4KGH9_9EUKA|nr:hypothetical protein TRFO_22686 [Tritrichomonas foetus]|eukprot:OHT08766.1 hypothetical protein TRFO_22686 [Tritrichomonas foetus]